MRNRNLMLMILAVLTGLVLGGCQMTGSAIQGVGGVINKTGGAVRNLGN